MNTHYYIFFVLFVVGYHVSFAVDERSRDDLSMCLHVKSVLFEDTHNIKMALLEWHHIFPKFIKSQIDQVPTDEKVFDIDVPYGPKRFNMLGPIGPACKTPIEHYGGSGDGQKRACGLQTTLQNLYPVAVGESSGEASSAVASRGCVIYSIGSANQWDFELDVVERTNCSVHTFDCTISNTTLPPESIRDRVTFHHVCLGDKNEGKFLTWESLHSVTGMKGSPNYLKMDIEGFEFPVMKSIIDNGRHLPLQIAMEIHTTRIERNAYQIHRRVGSMELFGFMQYLHVFGGYYLIDRRDNGEGCSEILLSKLDCQSHGINSTHPYAELKKQLHKDFAAALNHAFEADYYHS